MGGGIGLDARWGRARLQGRVRGPLWPEAFILTRLLWFDALRLRTVLVDLSRNEEKDPQDITKFERKVIVEYMGASPKEDGRPWI